MKMRLGIIEVEHQSEETLLVNFNDGTYSTYSVNELAALHPLRGIGDGDNAEVGQDSLDVIALPGVAWLRGGRI